MKTKVNNLAAKHMWAAGCKPKVFAGKRRDEMFEEDYDEIFNWGLRHTLSFEEFKDTHIRKPTETEYHVWKNVLKMSHSLDSHLDAGARYWYTRYLDDTLWEKTCDI